MGAGRAPPPDLKVIVRGHRKIDGEFDVYLNERRTAENLAAQEAKQLERLARDLQRATRRR